MVLVTFPYALITSPSLLSQVYVFDWPHRGLPALEKLVDLCRSMDAWLRADQCNVIVIHCSVCVT